MKFTVLGILLLLAPFVFIYRFPRASGGFLKIFILSSACFAGVALITQYFSIFSLPFILIILSAIEVLLFIVLKGYKQDWRDFVGRWASADKGWILVIFISILYLYQIHYNYTGFVQSVVSYIPQQVHNLVYPYPYYSDEWVAAAFMRNAIDTQSLPITNPFFEGALPFLNFGFVFYSFWAQILLLLGLGPVTGYPILAILNSTAVLLMLYLFLREDKVDCLPAAVAVAVSFYMINSANLPGLWYLIPMMTGLVFFIAALRFLLAKEWIWSCGAASLAMLLYPPLFIFYSVPFLAWGAALLSKDKKTMLKSFAAFAALVVLSAGIVSLSYLFTQKSYAGFFPSLLRAKGLFESYTGNVVPQYPLWVIIPPAVLALSVLGIVRRFRDRFWLLTGVLMGLALWALYAFWNYRILIDYQRVIVITSLLLALFAGYGLQILKGFFEKFDFPRKARVFEAALIIVYGILVFNAFSYTQRDGWAKLKLVHKGTGKEFMPAAPANIYLQPDDLRIFQGLKEKVFLSLPWKGLVIGVATKNYPRCIKAGTITHNRFLYDEFIKGTCGKKKFLARQYRLEYVYSGPFDCSGFDAMDQSQEGFVLYKVSR